MGSTLVCGRSIRGNECAHHRSSGEARRSRAIACTVCNGASTCWKCGVAPNAELMLPRARLHSDGKLLKLFEYGRCELFTIYIWHRENMHVWAPRWNHHACPRPSEIFKYRGIQVPVDRLRLLTPFNERLVFGAFFVFLSYFCRSTRILMLTPRAWRVLNAAVVAVRNVTNIYEQMSTICVNIQSH